MQTQHTHSTLPWKCLVIVLTLLSVWQPLNAVEKSPLPPIRVLTSEFPPYNYDDGSGEVTGLSTDVVQAVLQELHLKAKPENQPWARIYQLTQDEPNILIHSITRSKEREHLFKWVGVIAPADCSLWALASRTDIHINSIADLKPYRIGTTNNDVVEQYLRRQQLPLIDSVSGQGAYEQNIQKLKAKRIDLWGVSTLPGMYFLMRQGMEGKVIKVFPLKDIPSDGMYMAFGNKTDDTVVEQFRAALENIKRKGIYQQLLNQYGFSAP
ncbi:transporter substrate-binding domain-containing protein [Chitinibacter bivalviorum]|uniref:Transporter substrate-binding domain-containing protein n=1 Tax=Chitinibacter bivalviorum TaxID=2739434 RepID=A0A7H9BN15_9NEIS|nr:ABC transporter substrate-binding protein [Chitinibacter bivalviorum]QLG88764.1 transporter substrate-binding domain-containing protein [Chitinibacter bivalviorum]